MTVSTFKFISNIKVACKGERDKEDTVLSVNILQENLTVVRRW